MRVNLTQAAELLGVTVQQVHTWHARRARNGFPDGQPKGSDDKQPTRGLVWDSEALTDWRARYRPSRGGWPTGTRRRRDSRGKFADEADVS